MNFQIIQSQQPLADYVRFFWFFEFNSTIPKSFIHRSFAYPCPELIFCYKGQFKYASGFEAEKTLTAGIYGQTQSFSKASTEMDFGIFGIYLYPYALPQLFGLPASELTNQNADIKSFCGKEGEILEEKIMLAQNNNQRIKLVSDFLEARLKNVKTDYTNICSSIKRFQTLTR